MVENLDVCELSTVESHIRIPSFFRLVYTLVKRAFQRSKIMVTKKTKSTSSDLSDEDT